jgi:hypothetical protein
MYTGRDSLYTEKPQHVIYAATQLGWHENDDMMVVGMEEARKAREGWDGEADQFNKITERRGAMASRFANCRQMKMVTLLDCIFMEFFFLFISPKLFTHVIGVAS